jgi:hypothetical protein
VVDPARGGHRPAGPADDHQPATDHRRAADDGRASGWGRGNQITGNQGDLGADGEYGVRVDDDARGTVVGCDNHFSGAAKGLANIPCR